MLAFEGYIALGSLNNMSLVLRLAGTLTVLWLVLSGLFKTQLLILGVLSIALVVWLSLRLSVLLHRGQPLYFPFGGILKYWAWLLREIMVSNLAVVKTVLSRDMPIKPTLARVKATPNTELGRVIYANSITLTPGTTAINFTANGEILVHALHEDSLDELEKGEMADHIKALEPGNVDATTVAAVSRWYR